MGDRIYNFFKGSQHVDHIENQVNNYNFTSADTDASQQLADVTAEAVRQRGRQRAPLFADAGTLTDSAQMFSGFLQQHKARREFAAQKSDYASRAIVAFLRVWEEMGLVSADPCMPAVYRFLKESCGLVTESTPQTYANWLREVYRTDFGDDLAADVDDYFRQNG